MPTDRTRRKFIQTATAASTVGLTTIAGCTGGSGGGSASSGGGNASGDGNNSSGSSGGGSGESRTLSFATAFNPEHTQSQLVNKFGESLSEKTDGRYTVNLLAASIGGEEDMIAAASSGSVDMYGTAIASLTQAYGSEYGFLEAPFVAEDYEHLLAMAEEFIHGDGGYNDLLINQASQRILGDGTEYQGASLRGFRGTTSNSPVRNPSDVQGVKMRLPQFDTWVQTWQEIGVNATPVAFDELYSALQSGVVNASEGPIQQFVDTSLYEVQSHFSRTQHMLQTNFWVANESFWQELPQGDQTMINESLTEAIEWANQQTRDGTDQLLQMVQDEYDTSVIPTEEIDQDAFREAGRPQVESFFQNRWKPSFEAINDLA